MRNVRSINRRTRCTILLNADESLQGVQLTYQQIATLSGASLGTVFNTINKFCNDGLNAAHTPARHANSDPANLKVTGDIQAKIIAKACSVPLEGRSRRTLSLLEDEMAVILETRISRATIGRVLKNNDLMPHLMTIGVFHQKLMLNLLQQWKLFLMCINSHIPKTDRCGVWMKSRFNY